MIVLYLLLAHFIAEFIVDSEALGFKNKPFAFWIHQAIFLVVNAGFLYFITSLWLPVAVIGTVAHSLLDFFSGKLSQKSLALPVFLTKHFLQLCVIFGIAMAFGLFPLKVAEDNFRLLVIVNAILLVTIFTTYFIDAAMRQSSIVRNINLDNKDKILSIFERGVFLTAMLEGLYFLIPVIFIPRLLLQKTKILTDYRTDFLIGTAFTLLVYLLITSLL
jgi:hypothetical protein